MRAIRSVAGSLPLSGIGWIAALIGAVKAMDWFGEFYGESQKKLES